MALLSLEADTSDPARLFSLEGSADVIHIPVLRRQCLRSQDPVQKVHRSEKNAGAWEQHAETSQGWLQAPRRHKALHGPGASPLAPSCGHVYELQFLCRTFHAVALNLPNAAGTLIQLLMLW